ncbi:CXADR-like membrane protein [Onychomys torridus]|uniref:CXADR-like membrane protein n=1 Tax=Onychomys torridus TaxID=38674 RepID=UPI00167F32A8|nr:CXADR-like membrane protein [Onychomys torridus]
MLVVYLVRSEGLARNPRDKRNARGHISSRRRRSLVSAPSCRRPPAHVVSITQPGAFRPAQKPCGSATSLFGRSLAQPGWPPSRVALGSALLVYKTAAVARQPGAAGYRQRGEAGLLRSGSPGRADPAPSLQMLAKANTQQMTLAGPWRDRWFLADGHLPSLSITRGPLSVPSSEWVSYYVGTLGTHTEIKRVAEEKVTLPCHHQLGLPEKDTLDIEWLLTDNEGNQKVVITYSSRHVYNNLTEEQKGRVAFASNFLAGDASLQIEPLKPSDEGRYTCKVKNSGRYVWSHVILKVLVKPSKPKCELEGELTEGSDLMLQCESASGTKPIVYYWQRIREKEGEDEHLPPRSRIDYNNPGRVLLQNLTMDSSGLYQCTAGNEAGKESCVVRVTVQYVQSIGMVAGAVTGIVAGALLIFLLIWLLIRRKSKERYEEEERPNEIREDAEAPRARLVKPSSSSSGSRSSRSGSSSTRSTGNSASRSQRTLSSEAPPQLGGATQAYSLIGPEARGSEPKKVHHTTLTKAETTLSTIPSQSKAFQTV